MISSFALLVLAIFPVALAQKLTIDTPPGVVQCQPVQFTWTGGTAPYFLSLIPAGQPSAAAIKQFPTQNGTAFTWKEDLGSGTSFTVSLKDSKGDQAFSDVVNVQSGPDSSCVNTSIQASGSGGAAAPTSGNTSAGSAPAVATAKGSAAGPSASSGNVKATSTSGSASSSTGSAKPSNAASNIKGSTLAMAGVMGLAGAILF